MQNQSVLPNGLEHAEELENGVFNPQNRDAFSFTDDDSEIGENQNVGSVEVDNRPYPRVDNVRITRNLGSGDNVHVDDVSGTDETAENNDDDDPLYEGEFTPNSGSSYEYSDVSYRKVLKEVSLSFELVFTIYFRNTTILPAMSFFLI